MQQRHVSSRSQPSKHSKQQRAKQPHDNRLRNFHFIPLFAISLPTCTFRCLCVEKGEHRGPTHAEFPEGMKETIRDTHRRISYTRSRARAPPPRRRYSVTPPPHHGSLMLSFAAAAAAVGTGGPGAVGWVIYTACIAREYYSVWTGPVNALVSSSMRYSCAASGTL